MNQLKQYEAYVEGWKAKHGAFVKPKIHSMWDDEGERLAEEVSSAFKETGRILESFQLGKYLCGNFNSNIVVCPSGKVIEVGADNRGCWIYAEWQSMEDALTYDAPMPFFAYSEQW